MRTAGLGLALIATAQLTLLSTPAFADDNTSASGSGSASVSASGSVGTGTASATSSSSSDGSGSSSSDKAKTGWILIGVGGAVAIGGIVVNIVGANSGSVAGMGGAGDNGNTNNTRTDLYFLGTTMIVAGLVTGIWGGSLVWSADKGQDPSASKRPEEDAKADSITRAAASKLASAPSFVVPVLGATF